MFFSPHLHRRRGDGGLGVFATGRGIPGKQLYLLLKSSPGPGEKLDRGAWGISKNINKVN